jgi:O-antigen ligase
MLFSCSRSLAGWLELSIEDPESGNLLDQALIIVLICAALWILIHRKFDWSRAMKENAGLIFLIVFMLISILWSNIPIKTFKGWIKELLAILMAFAVLSEPSPRQAVESILRRTTYILIPFSLLLIKYFPNYGVRYGRYSGQQTWVGVTLHKNQLGRLCLIAAFFLIWSLVRRRQGHNTPVWKHQTHSEIFILVLALFLLIGPSAYSATSVISLGMGLLVYWGFYLIKKFGINLGAGILNAFVASLIIFGIVAFFTKGANVGLFASSARRDATLTGRTDVWAALVPVVMQKPIIGRGFGGFWTPRTKEAFEINEAHNGYLDVLLGLGFVGILLVSIFLLSSCRKAQRELSNSFDWGILCICFLIMALVYNVTESSIHTFTSPLTIVIMFFSVSSTNVFLRRRQF